MTLFKILYHHDVAPEAHGPPFIGAVRSEAQGHEAVFFDGDNREVLRLDYAVVRSIEDPAAAPRARATPPLEMTAWG